jgi:hypothetical protein
MSRSLTVSRGDESDSNVPFVGIRVRKLAPALLALLALSACGGGGDDAAGTTASPNIESGSTQTAKPVANRS